MLRRVIPKGNVRQGATETRRGLDGLAAGSIKAATHRSFSARVVYRVAGEVVAFLAAGVLGGIIR